MSKRKRTTEQSPQPPKPNKSPITTVSLTDDIIANILARLPVKPILRFRSVCKSWLPLLSEPCFIYSHLQRSSRSPRLLLFTERCEQAFTRIGLYTYEPSGGAGVAKLLFNSVLNTRPTRPLHCNGLLVVPTQLKIEVWNPATREFASLPTREFASLPNCGPNCLQDQSGVEKFGFGFGFDLYSKRYKVAHYFYRSYDLDAKTYSMGFEVFTLGTKSWRQMPEDPPRPIQPSTPATTVSGALYWKASGMIQLKAHAAILRFDLRDEKFSIIDPPRACWDLGTFEKEVELAEVRGSLCAYQWSFATTFVQLWRCNDYSIHAWTKSYAFDLIEVPNVMVVPLDIHDGKILIRRDYNLEYYSLKIKKLEAMVDMAKDLVYVDRQMGLFTIQVINKKLKGLMGMPQDLIYSDHRQEPYKKISGDTAQFVDAMSNNNAIGWSISYVESLIPTELEDGEINPYPFSARIVGNKSPLGILLVALGLDGST